MRAVVVAGGGNSCAEIHEREPATKARIQRQVLANQGDPKRMRRLRCEAGRWAWCWGKMENGTRCCFGAGVGNFWVRGGRMGGLGAAAGGGEVKSGRGGAGTRTGSQAVWAFWGGWKGRDGKRKQTGTGERGRRETDRPRPHERRERRARWESQPGAASGKLGAKCLRFDGVSELTAAPRLQDSRSQRGGPSRRRQTGRPGQAARLSARRLFWGSLEDLPGGDDGRYGRSRSRQPPLVLISRMEEA